MVLSLTGAAGAAEREQATKEGIQARAEVSQIAVDPALFAKVHKGGVLFGGGVSPLISEVEPNDTPATAQALATTPVRVRGNLFRAPFALGVDVDVYSFDAPAGSRVYAATMTSASAANTDTVVEVLDVDGTTILETDNDDGTVASTSSVIGGTLLANAGVHYVRVRQNSTTSLSGTIRPYDLYVRVLTGSPTPEVEPNNGTPNPLPANGWVSGTVDPAADNDIFSVSANAGDTIVAILDADPERDAPDWNPRVSIGPFNGFILVADGSSGDAAPAEALMMTVTTAGTYIINVDANAAAGGPTFTYNLSVSVIPAKVRTCTTYAGTGGAITDLGTTDFTLNIPDSRLIDYLRLSVNATHPATADLDVSLISPDGNEVFLFDDPGTAAAPAPQINTTLEDEAGIPMSFFPIHSGMNYMPEAAGRMDYFRGMQAQGNWILRVRDDLTANAGTLNSWSIDVCDPDPRPACLVPGPNETTVYSTDFEADDGGFTHTGTLDEWERGTPAFAPITTAHSGANAWKTDLDNTYENGSNQNLVSPSINLTAATGRITLDWWQKFNVESASFDNYWVEVRQVGNPAGARRVFEWTGAKMTRGVGNPSVTIEQASGWARQQVDISSFAGQNVEVVFHLETDTSVQLTGVAVDDVSVTSCTTVVGQAVSNLAVTKTDGQGTYFPGEQLTYTVVVTNGGPSAVTGATVADAFPATLTNVTWTCAASSGSSCTASGSGDINDTAVNLVNGGTATYTAIATVSGTATGDITNSATATVPGGWTDPDTANNTASDTDQLVTFAPLSLAVDTAGNRVFEPGETVVMTPSWTNNGAAAFGLTGTLGNHTGPTGGGATYAIPDAAADYGTIAAGGNGACTDCYGVSASATTRPVTHWDSTVLETTNTLNTKTWTLHLGNSFDDVATASPFYRFVETILHNGVTTGCAASSYCPASPTSRDQMAVFVLVSKEGAGYNPPACGTPVFNDVPASSPFCKFIEELSRRGVVAGCGTNPPLYCPTTPTTREQMSVFVLRTLDGTLDPPACVAGAERFADVPASSPFCKWIEELARRGVVTGCTATDYCPTGNVSREQMSVFLAVTFGLQLYGL